MSSTAWILLILLMVYIPIWVYAWRSPSAKKHGLEKYGPLIKINTRFGIRLMDRLCIYHRFWKVFGIYSQIVTFGLMAMMIYVMTVAVINLPVALSNGGMGVEYALAIPGLNPIMPFWYTLLALIVGLVFHELAHGMQTRTNGMRVKHTGLLYGVVPVGAFVEPEEEDVTDAPRGVKLNLYAAGVATNFTIAAVAFLLMSGMMAGMSSPYEGYAAVYQESGDSPADLAGIPSGAIILTVGGDEYLFDDAGMYVDGTQPFSWLPGDEVTVTYATEDGERFAEDVLWGAYVSGTVDGDPASEAGITKGCTLTYAICDNGSGGTVKTWIYSAQGFSDFMKTTGPGDDVTFGYVDEMGVATESVVTLGEKGDVGYLGIFSTTAGMSFITPERMLEIGLDPFYGCDTVLDHGTGLLRYISLPFSGFDPLPDSVHWWYGEQSSGFWILSQAFYWMFWLNLLLGITNALPAVPFDGGFVFMGWLDALLERAGRKDKEKREEKVKEITGNVSTLMLFLFMLVILAAVLPRGRSSTGSDGRRPAGMMTDHRLFPVSKDFPADFLSYSRKFLITASGVHFHGIANRNRCHQIFSGGHTEGLDP